MAELKIKPCPFCGGEMKFHRDSLQPYIEKILALSKPRKPIKSDRQGIRYVTTYECPNCGRKLDWSNEMDGEV